MPSNPVAPTTAELMNGAPNGADLSLVVSPQVRAWRALRDAAKALEAAANAALGEGSCAVQSHSLSPHTDGLITVAQVVSEFLRAKARAGRSDRYLRQLKVTLKAFMRNRSRNAIGDVTAGEIEKWLHAQDWSARTKRGYLSDVRTLFNFAVRRSLVSLNPAAGVELPILDHSHAPCIHTPSQAQQLLNTAASVNLDVCRHLAVRYFAGLRTAEAHRVTEACLLSDRGVLEVTADNAKTRRRRLVTIQPNLRAWLELGGELRPLGAMTVRAVIKASGVPWAHNVTRHSFVSYHLAAFGNAGKTALEAGHTEQMTFSNYRELVLPATAQEFWKIVPG